MKCLNCKKPTDSVRSIIQRGRILTGCDNCLATQVQGHSGAAKFNREWQKKTYRADLMQPNQPDFAKLYPDKFREIHGDEAYRLYG